MIDNNNSNNNDYKSSNNNYVKSSDYNYVRSSDYNYVKSSDNNYVKSNANINLKNSELKINLKLLSSGSFGIILKNEFTDEIYKITQFVNANEIVVNNFVEMIYFNFFKNKYINLYSDNSNKSFLPIQNLDTYICFLDDFINIHNVNKNILMEIKKNLDIEDHDIIIVNKMKYYPNDLSNFILKKKINMENILNIIERIILCLHLFHSNNLSHGDLKSNNIVLDEIDTKIIDLGGIKSIINPKYECTCTSTYRSPEDYLYEFRNRNEKNLFVYKNNSIKSDIWSLGLIMYEMVYGKNPILLKYYEIKNKNYLHGEKYIERKINEYLQTVNNLEITEEDKKKFNSKSNQEQLFWFSLSKTIEKILKVNPDERPSLDEIYLELFFKKLPDFEKYSNKFNYKINSLIFENKFKKFRNYYYQIIYRIMIDCDEIFLYPMLINLFDRFMIITYNSSELHLNPQNLNATFYINNDVNKFMDFNICTENIIFYDLENMDENNIYQFDHLAIITCTFYIISKILILKKFQQINLDLFKFTRMFSKNFIKDSYSNILFYVLPNLINILNKLNWDVPRTKLYFYPNIDKTNIFKIIKVIHNFEIENMIESIE